MTATAGTALKRPETTTQSALQDLEDRVPLLHEHAPVASPAPVAPSLRVPRQLAPERPTAPVLPHKGRATPPLYARSRSRVLLGAVVVALAGAAVATVMITSSTPEAEGHMGLSQQAWQEYRAGERSGVADQVRMGLTQQEWRGYRAGETG